VKEGAMTLTDRERFLRTLTFQSVDRIPLMDMGVWDETLDRWHHEGLPKWVTSLRHLEDYLQLDRSFNVNWLAVADDIYPPCETKILSETANEIVLTDGQGVTLRQQKWHRTIPQFLRFPVETEADYEALRPRLDGSDAGRYAADFDEDLHWRRERGEIVGVHFPAFFGALRSLMGVENLCVAYHQQPRLIERMIADRVQLAKALYARVLATGALDFVQIWEDMAYKTAALVSPAIVRRFMLPAYEELVAFFRAHGVPLIMVDSDGHVDELLPLWLAAGIDGCHPCEVAADSDPLALRRLAPRCALMGGIDKRAVASGRAGVDAELARLEPVIAAGGFIPMIDHFVPPDIAYDTYRYYVERRRERLSAGS
jgi:uroporphyrinogen decarboxylase